MSYIIGGVTLPSNPQSVTPRRRKLTKEMPLYYMKPLLMDFGARIPVLTVKGYVTNDTIANLWSNYLQELSDYALGPAAFPAIILDENPTTDWDAIVSGSGSYTITRADSSAQFKTGAESLSSVIAAGSSQQVALRQDFGSGNERDWSNAHFISWHMYGSASAQQWTLRFYDSNLSGYDYVQFNDPTNGAWTRFLRRLDEFSQSGGGCNWDDIRRIELTISPSASVTNYWDRMCVGVGYLVDFPGTHYDGIYFMNDFRAPEKGGVTRAVFYTLELAEMDEFYGEA